MADLLDDDPSCIRRRTRGRGVSFVDATGRVVDDPEVLAEIRALVVPPAWTDVRFCAGPDGRLVATGRDARGRKQYRYHPEHRAEQEAAKYAALRDLGDALPPIRKAVERDLGTRGMGHDRVVALVVRLLEVTALRVGNDEYARANKSYGLTTLLDRHVRIDGAEVRFAFRGKHGKDLTTAVHDRQLANAVRACRDLPGQRLFQYELHDGSRGTITSTDVNAYLRAHGGGMAVTAKHFRTWAGTLRLASTLARREPPSSAREGKRVLTSAIEVVSGELGNTPAVCRASYVHPAVLETYLDGTLPARWVAGPDRPTRWLQVRERRLLHLLEHAEEPAPALERPVRIAAA